MWQLLPQKVLYGYFALVGIGSFAVVVLVQQRRRKALFPRKSRSRGLEALKALPTTITVVGIVTLLVGKFTWAIAVKLPLVQEYVFPDVRGTWSGEIRTIWRDIPNDRAGIPFADTVNEGKIIRVVARIRQDWFGIAVELQTENSYSHSTTLAVWPEVKMSVGTSYRLWYVYKNETPEPMDGDATSHNGAAVVEVVRTAGKCELRGHYWTDRNWSIGKNTAGRITLARYSVDPHALPTFGTPGPR